MAKNGWKKIPKLKKKELTIFFGYIICCLPTQEFLIQLGLIKIVLLCNKFYVSGLQRLPVSAEWVGPVSPSLHQLSSAAEQSTVHPLRKQQAGLR